MASNYTITIDSVCTGGEHIRLQLKKDGVNIKKINVTKEDITNPEVDWDEVLGKLIRQAIKSASANTAAKRKAAIEGMVITL